MFDLCDCPEDYEYCKAFNRQVNRRQHQFLRGTSGLSRHHEELYIARMLGVDPPEPPEGPEPVMPNLVKQAVNFTSAVAEQALKLNPLVNQTQYEARLQACSTCDRLVGKGKSKDFWRCAHPSCGCFLVMKAWMATQDCPLKPSRWPLVVRDDLPEVTCCREKM